LTTLAEPKALALQAAGLTKLLLSSEAEGILKFREQSRFQQRPDYPDAAPLARARAVNSKSSTILWGRIGPHPDTRLWSQPRMFHPLLRVDDGHL